MQPCRRACTEGEAAPDDLPGRARPARRPCRAGRDGRRSARGRPRRRSRARDAGVPRRPWRTPTPMPRTASRTSSRYRPRSGWQRSERTGREDLTPGAFSGLAARRPESRRTPRCSRTAARGARRSGSHGSRGRSARAARSSGRSFCRRAERVAVEKPTEVPAFTSDARPAEAAEAPKTGRNVRPAIRPGATP